MTNKIEEVGLQKKQKRGEIMNDEMKLKLKKVFLEYKFQNQESEIIANIDAKSIVNEMSPSVLLWIWHFSGKYKMGKDRRIKEIRGRGRI